MGLNYEKCVLKFTIEGGVITTRACGRALSPSLQHMSAHMHLQSGAILAFGVQRKIVAILQVGLRCTQGHVPHR